MAKMRKTGQDKENLARNIQKQYKDLFEKSEPPMSMSIREAEALQARVRELEAQLEQRGETPRTSTRSVSAVAQWSTEMAGGGGGVIAMPAPQPAPTARGLFGFLRNILRAPTFQDLTKQRVANLQNQIILGLLVVSILGLLVSLARWQQPGSSLAGTVILVFELGILVFSQFLLRRGNTNVVSWILIALIAMVFIATVYLSGFTIAAALELALLISLAGLLVRPLYVVVIATLGILGVFIFNSLAAPALQMQATQVPFVLLILALEGTLLSVASQTLGWTINEVQRSSRALQVANRELQTLTASLEQRISDRTHDLELATEVGRAISEKVGNFTETLSEAVELIRSRFELYYTQVYLVDASGRELNLQAGTGHVGYELMQRRHHLHLSSASLNGRAVLERRAVIVEDTQTSSFFLPNPLLPLTRSEMAVPLTVNNKVIGVLDMQSERPNTFSEANLVAFEVLTSQLAIAIQNARLFQQAEENRQQLVSQASLLTSSAWQDFLNAIDRGEKLGFIYNQDKILSIAESQGEGGANPLVVPIKVAGASIGEIRLADEADHEWTTSEVEVTLATAARVAQQIENLRLLAEAERFRIAAEESSRRLTREGWDDYLQNRRALATGYQYDKNQVQPLNGNSNLSSLPARGYPIVVRDEEIGELILDSGETSQEDVSTLIVAVAEQLSGHIENLRLLEETEQRRRDAENLTDELARRATQLETVATLSTTASTLLDPDKLLQAVVDLTRERFELYHAHIYLADEAWQTLLLAAGAGEVGRKMVAQEHAIALNAERSLVARAARDQTAVIVNDVRVEPDFLPNPLLPDTRAEMAVPMIVGEKVLGVFDVQSNKPDGFSKEDAAIYATLASQVGVALQNARLYVEQAATVTQLRELDRLKSSFLANMSHELRTPLNSILGFADVILEELDGPLTENMQNDLGLIQKNGQHLLHLINDVLDMAKIEAGRMNLNPERFVLTEVLEEVTNITSTLASEKNLALFIEEDSDHEVEIYADRIRFRQVMINLINNAIKFTEKGKISISARPLDGAKVLIKVTDTGVGIPVDKQDAIFQEFTQVDASTTRKAGGTGLGLPISRRLVEMHGGRLWVESTGIPGEGSTFYVELPVEARITDVIEKQER